MCFYLKIVSFIMFYRFVIAIVCCRIIGKAVDFDGFMVFLPSHCQVPKLHFSCLYKFLVLIDK